MSAMSAIPVVTQPCFDDRLVPLQIISVSVTNFKANSCDLSEIRHSLREAAPAGTVAIYNTKWELGENKTVCVADAWGLRE